MTVRSGDRETRQPGRWWGVFLLSVLLFTADAGALEPQDIPRNDIFPLPESIRENVDFWVKVYSQWHSDQLIVHDASHLLIVYEVVDLRQLLGTDEVREYTRRRYARHFRRKYERLLRQAASKPADRLTPQEKRLHDLWKPYGGKSALRRAARNVRVQRGNRDFFLYGLVQSGRYIDRMREIFRTYGLPEELTALPHVESSFNWRAYSHMGAAGIWQFTRRTGRLFLRISYELDERFDPIRATEAAAQLLKKNYEELGTWPLAITAYNHGLAGMKRAVRILGTRDFDTIIRRYRSRSFRFASKNFYAEFLAALYVRTNYRRFFGEVQMEPPLQFVEFELPDYVSAQQLARHFGVDLEKLRELNPALRSPVWRGHRRIPRGYVLRLPVDLPAPPEALYASIPEKYRHPRQLRPNTYRVRRGETLGEIARRLGVPIRDLIAFNDIRNPNRIRAGQVLNVPPSSYRAGRASTKLAQASAGKKKTTPGKPGPTATEVQLASASAGAQASRSERPVLGGGTAELHWVPYDSSWSEASAEGPQSIPGLADQAEFPKDGWIRVLPEETLGHYAEWLKIPTQELRRLNGLAYGQDIRIGQRLRLTFRNVSPEEFHRQRVEYLRSIEEDFFQTYRVSGTRTHRIRRGENIWYLCHSVYDVPYWLVWLYNPDKDLSRLRAKDQVQIPVVEPVDTSLPEPNPNS